MKFSIRFVNFLLIFLFSQILYVNFSLAVHEKKLRCAGIPVTFVFGKTEVSKELCSTLSLAIDFLRSIGLETNEDITIRLVEHIHDPKNNELFGSYNAKTREVSILTYTKFVQEGKRALGIPPTENVWCSFAAHELAHAISEPFLSRYKNDHTEEEYIAVVTQFKVLSQETREKVLRTFNDVEPYKSFNEMSSLYYLMNPDKFSVKCYLHFISLENPREFIETLLQGCK